MTFNEEMILKHVDLYKSLYIQKFNEKPSSWFSYLKWLASCTATGNFQEREIRLVEKLLNNQGGI